MGEKLMIDPEVVVMLLGETERYFRSQGVPVTDPRIRVLRWVRSEVIDKAPRVAAVPAEEHELLERRLQHLLQSSFIRSFDQKVPFTGEYARDIAEADSYVVTMNTGIGSCSLYRDVKQISADIEAILKRHDIRMTGGGPRP